MHCCMCLEHNKGRHSPLGAMNRTRSFSFYPWWPARVCLDRAAMLCVWKPGSCFEPGLKSVTIRILHLWVTLFPDAERSPGTAFAHRAFIFWRYAAYRAILRALLDRQRSPLLSPGLSPVVVLFLSRRLGPFVNGRRTCRIAQSRLADAQVPFRTHVLRPSFAHARLCRVSLKMNIFERVGRRVR